MSKRGIADSTRTSGANTRGDWLTLRRAIIANPDDLSLWDTAFENYFLYRIESRFVKPIRAVEQNTASRKMGEGFSITAILCILIEYLQAYREGCIYTTGEPKLYEYNNSRRLFQNFLTQNEPFKFEFSAPKAVRFYDDVRCGLLHEAATKGNAKIMATGGSTVLTAGDTEFIVHRDVLLKALERYLELYREEFKSDTRLKVNFFSRIRLFNGYPQHVGLRLI